MDYIPFRVSTLRGDQKIDFNAYVRVNNKYILYVRRGDSFEGSRLQRLREKKLKKMFLLPNEEPLYRKYLERNIEMAYDKNSGKTIENRAEIIQGQQQNNAEQVFDNPDDVEAYAETKETIGKFVNFLHSEDSAFAALMSIDNIDANIAHHGVTVSTLSTLLAKEVGITDAKSQQLLALGALLHDFGHFDTDLKLNQPITAFAPQELALYKEHPRLGAQKVRDKKHFDQAVINIILQHEEFMDGNGFPNGLREKDIDPLAVVVATCNALDRIITFEGVARKEAMKSLMINKVGCYPLGYLQKLSAIVSKHF